MDKVDVAQLFFYFSNDFGFQSIIKSFGIYFDFILISSTGAEVYDHDLKSE